jgi:hypothetical protein
MTLDEDDIVTEVVGDPPVMADLQRAAVRRAREARALEDALIELRAMRGRLIVKGEPDRETSEERWATQLEAREPAVRAMIGRTTTGGKTT